MTVSKKHPNKNSTMIRVSLKEVKETTITEFADNPEGTTTTICFQHYDTSFLDAARTASGIPAMPYYVEEDATGATVAGVELTLPAFRGSFDFRKFLPFYELGFTWLEAVYLLFDPVEARQSEEMETDYEPWLLVKLSHPAQKPRISPETQLSQVDTSSIQLAPEPKPDTYKPIWLEPSEREIAAMYQQNYSMEDIIGAYFDKKILNLKTSPTRTLQKMRLELQLVKDRGLHTVEENGIIKHTKIEYYVNEIACFAFRTREAFNDEETLNIHPFYQLFGHLTITQIRRTSADKVILTFQQVATQLDHEVSTSFEQYALGRCEDEYDAETAKMLELTFEQIPQVDIAHQLLGDPDRQPNVAKRLIKLRRTVLGTWFQVWWREHHGLPGGEKDVNKPEPDAIIDGVPVSLKCFINKRRVLSIPQSELGPELKYAQTHQTPIRLVVYNAYYHQEATKDWASAEEVPNTVTIRFTKRDPA